MKLTKAQRHKVYKHCLKVCIQKEKDRMLPFICWTLNSKKIRISNLPELKQKKPTHRLIGDAWWMWHDYHSRINALKACIRETAPKKR